MKRINKKSFLALGLMLGLGALSVAYAALSTTLTIQSGTESEPGVSVKPLVTFVDGPNANIIGDDGNSTSMPINYYKNEYGYVEPGVVTITNNGLGANISGTTFSSTGQISYVLCVENKHDKPAYLAEKPTINVTNGEIESGIITVELTCDGEEISTDTEIGAGKNKLLLVTIVVKEMPPEPKSLSFTFNPQWTTEKPTTGSTGNQGE